MRTSLMRRARAGIVAATALAMVATMATAPVSAKTTKKKAVTTKKKAVTTKKKAVTTKKKAATTKKATVTTAAPAADQGQPKNIVGQEIPPGQPIKIGIQGLVGAEEFTGDLANMYEVAFATLRKQGKIPVHGRDIVLYFRGSQAITTDPTSAQRAACVSLVQDDKVFAALTYVNSVAAECLAENKIVALSGGASEAGMERTWPYLFGLTSNPSRSLRQIAPWAESLGLLKGRKLGLFHGTTAGRQKQIDDFVKPGFKKLGYSLEELTTGAINNFPDPAADRVAVQRFKSSGVNSIVFMGADPGGFAKAAQAQGYKPKYIYAGVESPFTCGGCPGRLGVPGDLTDGSFALAGGRFMEDGQPGNPPVVAEGVACASNYEKLSGTRIRQLGTPGEANRYQSVQWSCDQSLALITGLQAAGPKLTTGALINALETSVKGQKSGFIADITFTRTDHFGSQGVRTIKLDGSCLCWKAIGGLREPYVP